MAQRKFPLITEEIYHLFNRGIAKQPIFKNNKDYLRFLEVVNFYRFRNPPLRYSHFNRQNLSKKNILLTELYKSNDKLIEIYAFSFMPNHFHLLAKQLKENGIRLFMSQVQNSYAKYYNTKHKRTGALFQEMFKAIRIEDDSQFKHVARYIHLNPLTGYVLKSFDDLEKYPWNSYGDYVDKKRSNLVSKDLLENLFSKTFTLKAFTQDQVNYQKTLEKIKHLVME